MLPVVAAGGYAGTLLHFRAVQSTAVEKAALVYEPSGKDVIVEVADVMRADKDGRIADRWNRISMEDFIGQLDQNRKS